MARADGDPYTTGVTKSAPTKDRITADNSADVSPGIIARITGIIAGARAGYNGWFGPQDPLKPVAPDDARGRRFDYPYGVNLSYQPRAEGGGLGAGASLPFAVLRRVADPASGGLDILRLAIETRKDQMASQKWSIRGRGKNDDGGDRARQIEGILRRPDGVNTFRQWMRQLLEDHFVLDAATLYYRPTSDGPLLEVVDGATITCLIDERGRTPIPPFGAYQQIIKGLPATEYTTRELGYYMYNCRSNRIYGMSRVEQVIGIASIALNRQLSVMSYYTEGTVPDAFAFAPENWTPEQIEMAQGFLDSTLSGTMNIGKRRKLRILPGLKIHETKGDLLKNEFDEWLARIIAYCFSLSPQPFVKEMNRATSETAKMAAAEEGLEPTKIWFKDVLDDALVRIGAPELEFAWMDEEIQDPVAKASVVKSYTAGKPLISLNEGRRMIGLDPASGEALAQLAPLWEVPAPLGFGDSANGSAGDGPDKSSDPSANAADAKPDKADKVRKAASSRGRALRPLPRNAKAIRECRDTISRLAIQGLTAQRDAVLRAVNARSATKLSKVDASELKAMLAALSGHPWSVEIQEAIRDQLERMALERATAEMDRLRDFSSLEDSQWSAALEQANLDSIEWARDRVGNLVTNVEATTRQAINELTAGAIEDGLTNDELSALISDGFGFSEARGDMIARTETNFAETAGALEGYKASGVVVAKEWSTDAEACDECAPLDGVQVGLDEDFPNDGGDGPPMHPNCECVVVPVLPDSVSDE